MNCISLFYYSGIQCKLEQREFPREWMDEDTKAEYESFPKYKSCSISEWVAKVWDGEGFAQLVKGDDESLNRASRTSSPNSIRNQELSRNDWHFWR